MKCGIVSRAVIAIVLLASAGCATAPPAQTLAGQWDFSATIAGRPFGGTLRFEGAGGVVHGTFTGPMGQTRDLVNLRFDGSTVSFELMVRQQTFHASGTLVHDAITGTMTSDVGSNSWSAVRHRESSASATGNGSSSKAISNHAIGADAIGIEGIYQQPMLHGRSG